ncbi:MAG: Hsp20/alpha crystallin family protein [Candidatus Melainabacteria bacterium]|nr:Hsp20/alpha crystallin family protein [Candidatus Melainabacteria bacterium]
MNLIPYKRRNGLSSASPFRLLEGLHTDLNTFFDSPLFGLSDDLDSKLGSWLPEVDIHDAGDKLVVKTDLPGLNKDDIEVEVQGNTLFISGEKKLEEEVEDQGYLKSERYFGQFQRALPLGDDIDSSKLDANYKDGVLTVSVAKREQAKTKQIKVKVQ